MLLQYLEERLNALAAKWDRVRAAIRTPEDVKARDQFVRSKMLAMLGGLPEKAPLNPGSSGAIERDGYRIEKLLFQSRPNFWVPAFIYIPTTGRGPFPGIISPSGHYPDASREPDYQRSHVDLVKSGFVVLAYDPVGQGERREYWHPETGRTDPMAFEHSMFGQLLLLLGENITQYRVWDGIRALDYLEMRPEVDKSRLGCTGHSGGAFMTVLITALDQRVKCAVVNEDGIDHRWPVNFQACDHVQHDDAEHHLLPAALYGVDHCDMMQAIAPRPLLVGKEYYSDPKFRLMREHVQARYQMLGVSERFAIEQVGDMHALIMKLRLTTTDWFCRWFYGRKGPQEEPEFQSEPVEKLYCTSNGSLRHSKLGDTVLSLIHKKQAVLPPKRAVPRSAGELDAFRKEIRERLAQLLRYKPVETPLQVRHIATTPRKGYRVEHVQFLSEPGIYIPAWVFVPAGNKNTLPAVLYASEAGLPCTGRQGLQHKAIVGESGLLEKLLGKGRIVLTVGVRGVGETEPARPPQAKGVSQFGQLLDLETAMAFIAWAMDCSLLGMRVFDLVRSVDYLLSRPDVGKTGVQIIGVGMGALWTLFAATLDSRIRAVIADGGLLSYRTLTSADRYVHGADVFVPGILKHLDLPHIAAAMADRSLALLGPVNHMRAPVEAAAAELEYRFTRETYEAAGASGRFRIVRRERDPAGQYLNLLDA